MYIDVNKKQKKEKEKCVTLLLEMNKDKLLTSKKQAISGHWYDFAQQAQKHLQSYLNSLSKIKSV